MKVSDQLYASAALAQRESMSLTEQGDGWPVEQV
jgi:hypothetical protein